MGFDIFYSKERAEKSLAQESAKKLGAHVEVYDKKGNLKFEVTKEGEFVENQDKKTREEGKDFVEQAVEDLKEREKEMRGILAQKGPEWE